MDIQNITTAMGSWSQSPTCAGTFQLPPSCGLRDEEIEDITYTPLACENGASENCADVMSVARFDASSFSRE